MRFALPLGAQKWKTPGSLRQTNGTGSAGGLGLHFRPGDALQTFFDTLRRCRVDAPTSPRPRAEFTRGYPVLGNTFRAPISGCDTCPRWGASPATEVPAMPSVSPPSVSRWFAITVGRTRRYPMEPSWSGSSPVVPAIRLVRFAGNSLGELGDCGRWGGRDCRQGFAAVNRDLVAVGVGGGFPRWAMRVRQAQQPADVGGALARLLGGAGRSKSTDCRWRRRER